MGKEVPQMSDFLRARRLYAPGEIVLELGKRETKANDSRKIQVTANKFILPPYFIYHSCEPNTRIDWETLKFKALRDLKKGELVTYHYGTSEDDYLVGEFKCSCGSSQCVGHFRGFRYMTDEQKEQAAQIGLSPYLQSIWECSN